MIRKALNNPSLERHLAGISPDGATWFSMGKRASTPDVRAVLINGTRAVCQMQANHRLGSLETLVLGKGLLGAGLMACLLKDAGTITLRLDGNGPAEGMSADATYIPENGLYVRGRLFSTPLPEIESLTGAITALFGEGALTVTRREGDSSPVIGSVPLRTGSMNKDLTRYFFESEQTRTAIDSGVYFSDDGFPFGAGALLIQALPGADEDFLGKVESHISALPPLGMWFSQGGTRDTLISSLFGNFGARRNREVPVSFYCPCSHDRFLDTIASLDSAALDDILENGPWPLQTQCHYCSSTYSFRKEEIIEAAGRKRGRKDKPGSAE